MNCLNNCLNRKSNNLSTGIVPPHFPLPSVLLYGLFSCLLLSYSLTTQAQESDHDQRFISLAPHITELLFAVGAGDQIVGVVSYSDYPVQANEIANIGSYNQINYEQIVSLNPTLIFGWESGNGRETLDRLKSLGFAVHSHEPRSLEDVAESLHKFGELTGHSKQGTEASEAFRQRLYDLRKTYQGRDPVTVFYQLWNEPQMTVNGEHLISDVIRLCGGENIFADAIPLVPKVGVETILERNPEVIIASGMADERPEWLDDWKNWPSIRAVENEQLFSIHPDFLHRHSPRILQGAEQMCAILEQGRQLK